MKYLLVKAHMDYADEFDCEFFGLFTDMSWNALCAKTQKFFEEWKKCAGGEVEVYFGTNECLIFDSYNEWLRHFAVTEITEAEYNFLLNNFGKTWGTGSVAFNNIVEQNEDILADLKDTYDF